MMVLIMLVSSFILYLMFEFDKDRVVIQAIGPYTNSEQRLAWLDQNGYNEPFLWRYVSWVGRALTGDFGTSIQFNRPVMEILLPRLANTGDPGGLCVFVITVAISLVLGVLSGISRGQPARPHHHGVLGAHDLDPGIRLGDLPRRHLRLLARLAAGLVVLLQRLFLDRAGPAGGRRSSSINFGYYTRMTRASMAEVMTFAIRAHRYPQGPAVQARRHAGTPAQCADRALHRDDPAAQLSAVRRDRDRGVLRL